MSDPLSPRQVVDQVRADAAAWFAERPRLYRQRPSVVEAMRVTGSNFDQLADWTDGVIVYLDFSPGDYVVKGDEFRVYSPDSFFSTFERLIPAVAE